MAKEQGLTVDEVCSQLMLELAEEEGGESTLAQFVFSGYEKLKEALDWAARQAAEAYKRERARRAAEEARRAAEALKAAEDKIRRLYGQEVLDAMKATERNLVSFASKEGAGDL